MPAPTAFIAKMVGFYLLAFALYLTIEPTTATNTLASLMQSPPMVLVSAILALAAGLAIVLNHNVWTAGALAVIVTLVGWLSIAKGLTLLLLPPAAQPAYWSALHFSQFFFAYDVAIFLIGAYLVWGGFRHRR